MCTIAYVNYYVYVHHVCSIESAYKILLVVYFDVRNIFEKLKFALKNYNFT